MFPRLNDLMIITDKILMKESKKSVLFLALSLFFHINLILLLMFWKPEGRGIKKPLMEVEWVEFVSKQPDETKSAQIVDQEKNINGSIPEKDYRLSRSNRDVLKETRAKTRGDFRNVKNKWKNSLKSQNQQVKRRDRVSLDDLKPRLFEPKTFFKKKLLSKASGKLSPSGVSLKKEYALVEEKISFSNLESSQSDDYLKDVDLGSQTLLKTREFVYYSYYSRIKKKIKFHWEPKVKVKIVRALGQGRRIAAVNDRITRLVITLNQSGELTGVQVKNPSGLDELDEAAIEAFKEASPFPNPPRGLINEFGDIKIHWDFVLET